MNPQLDVMLSRLGTREDWEELWDLAKSRYSRFEAMTGRNFNIGDNVSFEVQKGRDRGRYTGTITKMATQRATIKTTFGWDWTIPYSWLVKVNGIK